MNNNNFENLNDEIDLKVLFEVFLHYKTLIIITTVVFLTVSSLTAIFIPNKYTSSALLAPSAVEDNFSNQISSFSSIANMAGINLDNPSTNKSNEAIERIKSYDFFVAYFLPNVKYENLVAAKKWNIADNMISYNRRIYNKSSDTWVRNKTPKKPSKQEAFEEYLEILQISEDNKTKFISIQIEHPSPVVAESWLKLIIKSINNYMADIDESIAKDSLEFLNTSIQNINFSEVKKSVNSLIEKQIQILTFIEANEDYVFKAISSPIAPEKKSSPARIIIILTGTILGFISSLLLSLFLNYKNKFQ